MYRMLMLATTMMEYVLEIFRQPGTTSVDFNLLHRFAVVMVVISSAHELIIEKFKTHCLDTAKIIVQLDTWLLISPTLYNSILIQRHVIIEQTLLPIETLSRAGC